LFGVLDWTGKKIALNRHTGTGTPGASAANNRKPAEVNLPLLLTRNRIAFWGRCALKECRGL